MTQKPAFFYWKSLIAGSLLAIFILVSCSGPSPTPTSTATENQVSVTPQQIPSETPTPTIAPTAFVIQPTPIASPSETQGVIVLSLADGLYKHLFAYHPSYLPLTRLTGNEWNFNDPVVSPDGKRLGYCADQPGSWQIYILNFENGEINQVTESDGYHCAPSWSPDGKWLAYESFSGTTTEVFIQSVEDLSAAPIQLTSASGNNYAPAWSPTGREIAFVTDRNGRAEIWLAHLDSPDNRFSVVRSDSDRNFYAPAWSPDGSVLAWCRSDGQVSVEYVNFGEEKTTVKELGLGCEPSFSPAGDSVAAILDLPLVNDLVGYTLPDNRLFLPPIEIKADISAMDWSQTLTKERVMAFLREQPAKQPEQLWQMSISKHSETGRTGIIALTSVNVPNPYLSDKVDESYMALRKDLSKELGWDFLSHLENAMLPLTTPPQPGLSQNWLYTGRAFAVSLAPLEAGWMAVSREDYSGMTYWRVWLKCRKQDGTCGQPVHMSTWDFNARYSGNQTDYQQGGKIGKPLEGFWLDFTEFSSRYGWQRLPSYSNWRSYFPASQINVFALTEGLTWQEALLELYPPEAVSLLLENQ